METVGKLINVTKDIWSGKLNITFQIDSYSVDEINRLGSIEQIDIIAKEHKKKRSSDANAYYWKLLTKLAEVNGTSIPFMHNMLLRKYGQSELFDGKMAYIVIPDTEEAEEKALESETFHIRPTSQVKPGRDGVMYRTYVMLRGSSSYNSYEMSKLIDGLISLCKGSGIETLPPDQLKRMVEAWQKG